MPWGSCPCPGRGDARVAPPCRIDDVNEVFFEVLTRIEEISTLNAILDLVESVFLRALFHELKHISYQVYYHDTDDATKVAHFQNACALASVADWEDTLLLVSRPWVTLMRRKGGDGAGEDKRACAGWLPRLEFRGCFGCVCTV